jgi:hypothetical protein
VGKVIGGSNAGGIAGYNIGTIKTTYWDIQATNKSSGIGNKGSGSTNDVISLKTSEMTGKAAKSNMKDFDFSKIWIMTKSYPILFWQK